jgi:TetR/AcrR family transcriptional regulator, regulator of autoinduction and epiphytic fitness
MMPEKRKYNSTRRQTQAQETRRQIIESARRLFFTSGYGGTTIESIAHHANVATETVYATFGNKIAILTRLIEVSIVGDDEPVPLLERPNIQATSQITDPHLLIETFASDIYDIMQRMSPMFMLLRATAQSEPEIAALLDRLLKERLRGMTLFVGKLANTSPLRENLSLEKAAETVWTLSSGEVFHLLMVDRAWTREKYVEWLVETLEKVLLP